MFDKIPVSTIKLLQWRFQAFLDVSLFERLIWKSCSPQDKTSIRWASPGISYKLRNKDAICGQGWNIATQERKICDVEIEIVTFVINGSVKLTVPPDRQKYVQVRSRSDALCRVFDLEFNLIHLAQVILKLWVVYGQNIIDVPVCEIRQKYIYLLKTMPPAATKAKQLVFSTHIIDLGAI